MAAYWSQIVDQLSTQRARWISQHSKQGSPSEQTGSPMEQQPSPETSGSSPLQRENALLKLELAGLNAQIDQLSKILDSRAAQIQVLVDCTRHLRLQQRRMTSLSSMDGTLEEELCHGLWLSLDEISSTSSSSSSSSTDCSDGEGEDEHELSAFFDDWYKSDGEDEHELSAFFDGWCESDGEEKHEEAALVEPTARQLGRSVSIPPTEKPTEKEQHRVELRSQSLADW